MSKVNKQLAAKKAAQSKQYSSGNINVNGQYQSQYSQGMDAYTSGVMFSQLWSAPKQQGWMRVFKQDKATAENTALESVRVSVIARIHRATIPRELAA